MASLTREQRKAMACLGHADRQPDEAPGYVTTVATFGASDFAWVHWRTADALERRGLVRLEADYDAWLVWLTDAGRDCIREIEGSGDAC